MKAKSSTIVIVVAVVLMLAATAGRKISSLVDWKAAAGPAAVSANIVRTVSMVRYERANGRVANLQTRKLLFRGDGILQSSEVKEGDMVREGQALAHLKPDTQWPFKHQAAIFELQAAQVQQQNAEQDLYRLHTLYEAGIEPEINYKRKQDDAKQAQLKVAQARLKLQQLQQEAQNSILHADGDGQVISMDLKVGESVANVGLKLSNPGDNLIEAQVDEQTAAQIALGQTVLYEALIAGRETLSGQGQVSAVRPSFERERDFYAVKVYAHLQPAHRPALRLNQQLQLKFAVEEKPAVLAVPTRAVISEAGHSFVLILNGNIVRRIAVETGIEQNNLLEVRSPQLQAGQAIAIPLATPAPADGAMVLVKRA